MKRFFSMALAFVVLASCTKEPSEVDGFSDDMISISSGIVTRASGINWAANDEISVFVNMTDESEELYANKKHIAKTSGESSTFSPASDDDYIFYPASGNVDIYAIYPHATSTSLTEYEIDVTTQTNHPAIDLMVAKETSVSKRTDAVEMTFNHMLSQITVTLSAKENGGFSDSDLAAVSVKVGGTKVAGNYNFTTGEITTSGDATELTLTTASRVATFMVIPQTATPEFTITVDDVDYTVTASSLAMESGNTYSYAISVSKTEVKITGSTINDWTTNNEDDLDATIPIPVPDIELIDGVYYVNSAEGLQAFADLVNGVVNDEATAEGDITFSTDKQLTINGVLTADVDLGDVEWTPIGNSTNYYQGTFDGGGHLVSGLSVTSTALYTGFFGCTDSPAQISNLGVNGSVNVESSYYLRSAGSLVGNNNGIITNCYNLSEVDSDVAGGIVGCNNGTITNCYNMGSVHGNNRAGGVASHNDGTIANCYNTGSVSSGIYTGGVVAINSEEGTITNCFNTANVSGETNGGVVGVNYCTITNCYWNSDVYDGSGIGEGEGGTEGMSTEAMKASSFVTTLNNNASSLTDACAWVAVSNDYPMLDFDAEPFYTADITYTETDN